MKKITGFILAIGLLIGYGVSTTHLGDSQSTNVEKVVAEAQPPNAPIIVTAEAQPPNTPMSDTVTIG